MNRYVVQGIAADISEGHKVVIIPAPYDTVHNILHQISEYTDESYTSVSHATSVVTDASGGGASIVHDTEKLHDQKVDVLVVPHHADPSTFRIFLKPGTELIRY